MARGDHLFVHRFGGVYAHHGIDCGDGSVIHFGAENWYTSRSIERTTLDRFAREDAVEVRDYSDFFSRLRDTSDLPRRLELALRRQIDALLGRHGTGEELTPDAVIARAERRLGDRRFNVLFHNCEHFATWCKTGMSDSEQVNALWRLALGAEAFRRMQRAEVLTRVFEGDWWHAAPRSESEES